MSDPTTKSAELELIVQIYKANLDLLKLKTEPEIDDVLTDILAISARPVICYRVDGGRLELKYASGRNTDAAHGVIPQNVDISPESLETIALQQPGILGISDFELPHPLKSFFQKQGCDQIAVLAVTQVAVIHSLIFIMPQGQSPLELANLDPLIQTARVASAALSAISTDPTTAPHPQESQSMAGIAQTLISANTLREIYELLHSSITAWMGNVDFAVALYNPLSLMIEFPYISEAGEVKSLSPIRFGEGIVSVLIRTRQPLMMVADTERHLNALGAKVIGPPAKSWLGCPLNVGSATIGALIIQDLKKEQRFSQSDFDFLIALSGLAANIIDNLHQLEIHSQDAQVMGIIAETACKLSATPIIDDLIKTAIRAIVNQLNFDYAAVYLSEPGSESVILRELGSNFTQAIKNNGTRVFPGEPNLVGRVLATNERLVVNDILNDTQYPSQGLIEGSKSRACYPLLVIDRVVGVLDLQSRQPFAFSSGKINAFQLLANQLATVLANSEAFTNLQERISQHRILHHVIALAAASPSIQEALNNTVQGLQVALGGDQITILIADKDQKTLEVKASIGYSNEESARLKVPFGVGVVGWVAANRRPQYVNDVTKESRYISLNPKVRSELAIPLVYRSEVLGVLNIESMLLNAYNEQDEEMLITFAESMAAILAHSRLLEQYRRQVERERLLSEITNRIRRTTNPQTILSITAEELSKALNTRRTKVEVSIRDTDQSTSMVNADSDQV